MIAYLVELTLVWLAGLTLYGLLTRRLVAHGFNRAFLLLTLAAGPIVPLLPDWLAGPRALVPALPRLSYWLPEVTVSAAGGHGAGWHLSAWLGVYLAGVAVAASVVGVQAWRLARVHRGARRLTGLAVDTRMRVYESPGLGGGPFAFGRNVYLDAGARYDAQTLGHVLQHEAAHRRLGHTIDNVALALAAVALWFHPLVYVLRRELRLVHEFQADAAVVGPRAASDRNAYRSTLLDVQFRQPRVGVLTTAFHHSPLKRRFDMLNRSPLPHQWLPLTLATLSLVGLAAACTKEEIDPEQLAELNNLNQAEALEATSAEIINGARVVGVDTIEIFDPETFESTVQIVKRLEYPDGERAEVLSEGSAPELNYDGTPNRAYQYRSQPVYNIVEEMPRFPAPGCVDMDCAQKAMLTFMYEQIEYPAVARARGVEGRVIVNFIVGTDGELVNRNFVRVPAKDTDPEVARAFEAEVSRLLDAMPAWVPGRQDGQTVQTRFTLPVMFKLG